MIEKIISGGQTGADIAGLDAALECNIPIGGTAAAFYTQSVDGKNIKNPELKTKYRLVEGETMQLKGKYGYYTDVYHHRTIANAQEADGTIWFGDVNSPGGKLTLSNSTQKGKPDPLINPNSFEQIQNWITDNNIKVLNVAGNRESKNPGIYLKVYRIIKEYLSKYNK